MVRKIKHPEFIKKINWKLLREQKEELNKIISSMLNSPYPIQSQFDALEGILCLIDAIQDYATDEMGMSDKEVFNLTSEEE